MNRDLPHDLTKLLPWVQNLLFLMIACEAANAFDAFRWWSFVGDMQSGAFTQEVIDQKYESISRFDSWVGAIYLAAYLACAISGGIWIYRASKNAAFLLPDADRITPGWAVGWHFIPIANLWKPYQAMREIYNSSISPQRSLGTGLPLFFLWWWVTYVMSDLLGIFAATLWDGDWDRVATASVINMINTPVAIVAILLWLKTVSMITDMQRNSVNVFA